MLLLALAGTAAAQPAAAQPAFRRAQTPAEQALDALLRRVSDDDAGITRLMRGDGRAQQAYAALMTPALMRELALAERQAVQRNCGGRYRRDDICGLDYVVPLCAQDIAEHYLLRTLRETADSAEIAFRFADARGTEVAGQYRLRRQADGSWRADGIRCTAGNARFNWTH